MKYHLSEKIIVPESVKCSVHLGTVECSKGEKNISRKFSAVGMDIKAEGQAIILSSIKANKKTRACILSVAAHVRNMLAGLDAPYAYELEICNVHFPMTVKVEKEFLVITNFLGEKEKRLARIIPSVSVGIHGQKIIVSGINIEDAGQTAANIEKATWISKRDRRVFQDGIFITSKCGRPI